ncbi:PAS domain-containing protein [Thioclava sp. FR2]|uniref:PAS domain-containing protein n=1 Tax=Thioclava sp. FR2 TaxID=3445780 RepID=UPI003EB894F7
MVIRSFGNSNGTFWTDQGLITEVRAYWEALRKDGDLPKRHQIDPRGFTGALENVFLIERIGTGIARFRIAGFAFHDLMGMDIRGMPFSCLFIGEAHISLRMNLERAFTGPSVVHLSLTSARTYSQPELSAKMTMLPVIDGTGATRLVLGCLEIAGQIRKAPRRFQIESTSVERINLPEVAAIRPIADLPKPLFLKPLPPTGQGPIKSKPILRLVHSAD